ncbi:MAG: GNAT family N-acetyltransferase [Pirellulales bacterium]|nr:GNAT family N-acetyltransferase [Pirellulales bacterium]
MKGNSPAFSLNDVRDTDMAFLRELRRITMMEAVTRHHPWVDSDQDKRVALHLDSTKVIVVDGRAVGMVKVLRGRKRMRLSQIQLLPEYQNRGIGTAIIRGLQEECRQLRIPLRLRVLEKNRSRGLYELLGFTVTGHGTHTLNMEWNAS